MESDFFSSRTHSSLGCIGHGCSAISSMTLYLLSEDSILPLQIQISRYRHHGFSSLAARQASASGYLAIAEAMEKRDESLALETVDASVRRLVNEVVKAFTP